ncbi:hypothetical protein IFT37_17755 [Pseudomonas fluorescens]|uniref:hypothetical protein n=1 Tax=Pseudomonas fluorescens TaxID=294 RepID=UPI0017825A22|nr:hypothetical protein [Pseudomonas fluorescens]MBD8147782.1 hypothetical protein [Pseudomonas fluorescens]MBD8177316.1 hypothetical protein [Pseudomonas fluorescens]MBD8746957.1 hypothetical protein [Pseudomonas fluorescens]MBD8753436.1 hypothetical protein [Pseudomonas fluorescens]MBD8759747.1 hypothetical protein [Pseudomonas fluorescens]
MSKLTPSERLQQFSVFAETLRLALENGKSNSSTVKTPVDLAPKEKIEIESEIHDSKSKNRTLSISKRPSPPKSTTSPLENINKTKIALLSRREKSKKRKEETKEKENATDKTTIKALENYLKIARDKNSELKSRLEDIQKSQEFVEGGKRHLEIREILRKAIIATKEKSQENEKLKKENIKLRKIIETLTFKLHGTTGDSVYYGGHYSEADS